MSDRTRDEFNPDELGMAFEHPSEVVNDPDLTINGKRAILRGSNACAIEASPDLRAGRKGSPAARTLDR